MRHEPGAAAPVTPPPPLRSPARRSPAPAPAPAPGSRDVGGLAAVGLLVTSVVAVLALGTDAPAAASVALFTVALAAHATVLARLARGRGPGRRVVLGAVTILCIASVVAPPVTSRDVHSYATYGRMVATYDLDPYRSVPADLPDDPWARRVPRIWQRTPSVYGPLFTAVSGLGMTVAGTSWLVGRLFFQALSALGLLACLLLLARARSRTGRGTGTDAGSGTDAAAEDGTGRLAFLGLSPVVAVGVVNGAHNDMLVGLAVLAGVLLAGRRRWVVAGVVVALGALVKLVALIPLGALVVWAWRAHGRRPAVNLALPAGLVVLVGQLAAGGVTSLGPVRQAARMQTRPSVWWAVREQLAVQLGDATARQVVGAAALAAMVVLGLVLVLPRLRHVDPTPAVAAAVAAWLLTAAYVQPWYGVVALPALALRWRSRLALLVWGQSAVLLLAFIYRREVDGQLLAGVLRALHLSVVPVVQVVVVTGLLLGAVARARRSRRRQASAGTSP